LELDQRYKQLLRELKVLRDILGLGILWLRGCLISDWFGGSPALANEYFDCGQSYHQTNHNLKKSQKKVKSPSSGINLLRDSRP
jgi:hypothetical protein